MIFIIYEVAKIQIYIKFNVMIIMVIWLQLNE